VPIDRWLRGPLKKWPTTCSTRELGRGGLRRRRDPLGVARSPDRASSGWSTHVAVIMFQAWRTRWQV
jgi:hypothetical protein